MRFLVMVKATKESEAGELPTAAMLARMGKFNEGLVRDGVMLTGEGLQATSKGARMKFGNGENRALPTGRSPRRRSWSPASGSYKAARKKRSSSV